MEQSPFEWAGRIRATPAAIEALSGVRLLPRAEALRTQTDLGEMIWVRGPRLQTTGEKTLTRVPWDVFYTFSAEGLLLRKGRLLPEGKLPGGNWMPLMTLIQPCAPSSALPGKLATQAPIELRADAVFREANLMEATLLDWLEFSNRASEIRLQKLAWALDSSSPERVLIRGTPLPPLPGRHFVEENGVAVPAGLMWWPRVSAESIRAALRVPAADMVILHPAELLMAENGNKRHACGWRRMPRSAWLPAKRSTIRTVSVTATTPV